MDKQAVEPLSPGTVPGDRDVASTNLMPDSSGGDAIGNALNTVNAPDYEPTVQQQQWNNIHSYKGYKPPQRRHGPSSNSAIRRMRDNADRSRWQANQIGDYAKQHGTSVTQGGVTTYSYRNPYAQNNDAPQMTYTHRSRSPFPAYAPAAAESNNIMPTSGTADGLSPVMDNLQTLMSPLTQQGKLPNTVLKNPYGIGVDHREGNLVKQAVTQATPGENPTMPDPIKPISWRESQNLGGAPSATAAPAADKPIPLKLTRLPDGPQGGANDGRTVGSNNIMPPPGPVSVEPRLPGSPGQGPGEIMPTAEGVAPDALGNQGFDTAPDQSPIERSESLEESLEARDRAVREQGLRAAKDSVGEAGTVLGQTMARYALPGRNMYNATMQAVAGGTKIPGGGAFSPGRFGQYTDDVNSGVATATKGVRKAVSTAAKPITVPVSAAASVPRRIASAVTDRVDDVPTAKQTALGRRAKNLKRGLNMADDVAKASTKATTTAAKGFSGAKALGGVSKKIPILGHALEAGGIGWEISDRMQDDGQSLGQAWKSQAEDHTQGVRNTINPLHGWRNDEGNVTPGSVAWNTLGKTWGLLDVISPVATAQAGSQLVGEMGGGAWDAGAATGRWLTNAKERGIKANYAESQQMATDKVKALGQEAAQLQSSQDPQSQARYAELQAQADDWKRRAEAMSDQTKDWNVGNTSTFGSSYPFRDAMSATGEDLKKQINEMKTRNGAPPPGGYQPGSSVPGIGYPKASTLSEAEKLDLENMQQRQSNIERMQKRYDDEVGYWGSGDMPAIVRNRVATGKKRIVDIGARLREPAVRNNPQLVAQLQADLKHHTARMADYQAWADAAR